MQTTIERVVNEVLNLQSFSPDEYVNRLMTDLVESIIEDKTDLALLSYDSTIINRIRYVSGEAESELEKFWAKIIISSNDPGKTLSTFPYLDNYVELTKRELQLVKKSGLNVGKRHKILVVGSGPLPLTAYELYKQTGSSVDHVDASAEAIKLCEGVSRTLSMNAKYYQSPGESVMLQGYYDVIVIAALAGETTADKQKIVHNILPHLSEGGRIIVRSARGARTLLYPAINPDDIKGITRLEEYHPTDHIINSVLIYGK